MASALLASRNEPHWGERKVYMRKNPNPNPNPNPNLFFKTNNPNPNPKKLQIYNDPSSSTEIHGRHAVVAPSISNDSSTRKPTGINISSIGSRRGESSSSYVTFKISAYSKRELKDLKKRLISELQQVQNLNHQIETRELQTRSTGYSAVSHYPGGGGGGGGGGYAGREVTSATTTRPPPPPLHVNFSDSQAGSAADGLRDKRTPKGSSNIHHYRLPSEFLTGKEKMPPPPSEPSKKISGNKRPPPPFAPPPPHRDLKRPAPDQSKMLPAMVKQCEQILSKLMKHKHGYIFNTPVDVIGMKLHDYHQIIKNPMDLGTVKVKLQGNVYETPVDFASDVRLTFDNALRYNPKGHEVYVLAEVLQSRFEKLFQPVHKKFESEQRCSNVVEAGEMRRSSTISLEAEARPSPRTRLPTPDSVMMRADEPMIPTLAAPPTIPQRPKQQQQQQQALNPFPVQPRAPPPPPAAAPIAQAVAAPRPSISRAVGPKPKAKDPNKREMSSEEKEKLRRNLVALPEEKMEQVVAITRKSGAELDQHGDTVEIDLETLNKETLWELDRFICNYKKMINKVMRQRCFSSAANQSSISASEGNNKSPASIERPDVAAAATAAVGKKVEEEDVDIGEELPTSSFPPLEIEKDAAGGGNASSGSSSSSSGSSSDSSSSSDSDSGSSSDSDSDADEAQS